MNYIPSNSIRSKAIHLFVLLITTLFYQVSLAQDITGTWNGLLSVQGTQLRLTFHVTEKETGYAATMDSPDQGAFGIPVSGTQFEDSEITFIVANAGIKYTGTLEAGTIKGTFQQGAFEAPMNLSRESVTPEKPNRPQEPVAPFPYLTEEVTFYNPTDAISLSGTLTLPEGEGPFPAAILISGSGPQNRDEELMGHKPFLVLSDHLTRNGIAVLRFDDRGVGDSEGNFSQATSADFAKDVNSAFAFLKSHSKINTEQIGLIGHSEGGLIAPMVAAENSEVAFAVLLAGPGISGADILRLQTADIARANGMSPEQISGELDLLNTFLNQLSEDEDIPTLKNKLTTKLQETFTIHPDYLPEAMDAATYIESSLKQVTPWMVYFLKHDPATALLQVQCPVLAINGEKDLQVASAVNLEAIKDALESGGNRSVTIKELPGLNHLFQECETGSPSEYAQIEQTFSRVALMVISDWILTLIID